MNGFLICALVTAMVLLTGCGAEEEAQSREGELEAVFFDVGKGDCVLLSLDGAHILIDSGYEETADDVIDGLSDRGVESLDAMIITHYDKDHVGGAAQIADQIPVGRFYLPDYEGEEDKCGDLLELIDEEGLDAERVSSDLEFSLGDASVKVDAALVAYDPELENDNDASLIVEVRYGEDEWLFPGDIEKDAIAVWLDTHTETFDVLKVPHHGRKEKNSDELIEAIDPGIAVITDSEEDEPSAKVLKNLEKNDTQVYRSALNGTVTIIGNGQEQYRVNTEK